MGSANFPSADCDCMGQAFVFTDNGSVIEVTGITISASSISIDSSLSASFTSCSFEATNSLTINSQDLLLKDSVLRCTSGDISIIGDNDIFVDGGDIRGDEVSLSASSTNGNNAIDLRDGFLSYTTQLNILSTSEDSFALRVIDYQIQGADGSTANYDAASTGTSSSKAVMVFLNTQSNAQNFTNARFTADGTFGESGIVFSGNFDFLGDVSITSSASNPVKIMKGLEFIGGTVNFNGATGTMHSVGQNDGIFFSSNVNVFGASELDITGIADTNGIHFDTGGQTISILESSVDLHGESKTGDQDGYGIIFTSGGVQVDSGSSFDITGEVEGHNGAGVVFNLIEITIESDSSFLVSGTLSGPQRDRNTYGVRIESSQIIGTGTLEITGNAEGENAIGVSVNLSTLNGVLVGGGLESIDMPTAAIVIVNSTILNSELTGSNPVTTSYDVSITGSNEMNNVVIIGNGEGRIEITNSIITKGDAESGIIDIMAEYVMFTSNVFDVFNLRVNSTQIVDSNNTFILDNLLFQQLDSMTLDSGVGFSSSSTNYNIRESASFISSSTSGAGVLWDSSSFTQSPDATVFIQGTSTESNGVRINSGDSTPLSFTNTKIVGEGEGRGVVFLVLVRSASYEFSSCEIHGIATDQMIQSIGVNFFAPVKFNSGGASTNVTGSGKVGVFFDRSVSFESTTVTVTGSGCQGVYFNSATNSISDGSAVFIVGHGDGDLVNSGINLDCGIVNTGGSTIPSGGVRSQATFDILDSSSLSITGDHEKYTSTGIGVCLQTSIDQQGAATTLFIEGIAKEPKNTPDINPDGIGVLLDGIQLNSGHTEIIGTATSSTKGRRIAVSAQGSFFISNAFVTATSTGTTAIGVLFEIASGSAATIRNSDFTSSATATDAGTSTGIVLQGSGDLVIDVSEFTGNSVDGTAIGMAVKKSLDVSDSFFTGTADSDQSQQIGILFEVGSNEDVRMNGDLSIEGQAVSTGSENSFGVQFNDLELIGANDADIEVVGITNNDENSIGVNFGDGLEFRARNLLVSGTGWIGCYFSTSVFAMVDSISIEGLSEATLSLSEEFAGNGVVLNPVNFESTKNLRIRGSSQFSDGIHIDENNTGIQLTETADCKVTLTGESFASSNSYFPIHIYNEDPFEISLSCEIIFEGFIKIDGIFAITGSPTLHVQSGGEATDLLIESQGNEYFPNGFKTEVQTKFQKLSGASRLCGNFESLNFSHNLSILVDCTEDSLIKTLKISGQENAGVALVDGNHPVEIHGSFLTINNRIGGTDSLESLLIDAYQQITLESNCDLIVTTGQQNYISDNQEMSINAPTLTMRIEGGGTIIFDCDVDNGFSSLRLEGNSVLYAGHSIQIETALFEGTHTVFGTYAQQVEMNSGSIVRGLGEFVDGLTALDNGVTISPDVTFTPEDPTGAEDPLRIGELNANGKEIFLLLTFESADYYSRIEFGSVIGSDDSSITVIATAGTNFLPEKNYFPIYSRIAPPLMFYNQDGINILDQCSSLDVNGHEEPFIVSLMNENPFLLDAEFTLSTKINSPPVTDDSLSCQNNCEFTSTCACCSDVLGSASDADDCSFPLVLAFDDSDLFELDNRLCMEIENIMKSQNYTKFYQVEDKQGIFSQSTEIYFSFIIPPSFSSTKSHSNSFSSSRTVSGSHTPTPSIPPAGTSSPGVPTLSISSPVPVTVSFNTVPSISTTITELRTKTETESLRLVIVPPLTTESNSPIHFPSKIPSVTPTSRMTPTSAANAQGTGNGGICVSCDSGSASLDLDLSDNNEDLMLTSQQGNNVGSLIVPDSVAPGGNLVVSFVSNLQIPEISLGNTIIDVTLQDVFGQPVTQLSKEIEICLEYEGKLDESVCLSFFNIRTNKWECEDECLERNGNQFCGRTDHLTSFALLLDGSGGGSSKCSSSPDDYLITWLSCGSVVIALILIFGFVFLNELRIQHKAHKKRQILSQIQTFDATGHNISMRMTQ